MLGLSRAIPMDLLPKAVVLKSADSAIAGGFFNRVLLPR